MASNVAKLYVTIHPDDTVAAMVMIGDIADDLSRGGSDYPKLVLAKILSIRQLAIDALAKAVEGKSDGTCDASHQASA